MSVPKLVTGSTYIYFSESIFISLNNEIKFDMTLIGFELYGAVAGYVNLRYVKLSDCGQIELCSSYYSNSSNQIFSDYQTIVDYSIYIPIGYYKYMLTKAIDLKKGYVLIIYHYNEGRIGVDTSGSAMISDYYRTYSSALKSYVAVKLNSFTNYRFYINTLVDPKMYSFQNSFTKIYSQPGSYKISAEFQTTSVHDYLDLTDCEFTLIFGIFL